MGILVIDDASGDTPVAALLRDGGFSDIREADSIDSALQVLKDAGAGDPAPIDLILLDVTSPRFGGYELCRRIHEHPLWQEIPVIALRPRSPWHEAVIRDNLDAGASDVIFRPIGMPELMPHVISALLLKRERDFRLQNQNELEAELAERKVMEARLQYLVSHDDLTGLANRRRLEQMLEHTIAAIRRKGIPGALLYIDLDQFKIINDLEGHGAGDRLLMSVANILRTQLRKSHILARISSDEYAVLIDEGGEEDVMSIAERIRREIDAYRFRASDREYQISASIGVLLIAPDDDVSASEALARSAQACFEAKHHGRNLVHLFNEDDLATNILRDAVDWVPRIREALAQDGFVMLFQPVIDLGSNRIVGYEALIRMTADDGTLITPDRFIPVAERMGLIHDIDLWVVGHAMEALHALGPDHPHVSLNINLSIFAFQDRALLALVRDKLATTGLAADRITFEITETAAVANYDQTRDMVNQLRAMGCRFALDDFGTGFSSFNYLKQFPVDYLKIDGSFISNLLNDPIDQQLVKSMIEVGRALGKKIVAEYVENAETLALLRQFGVDRAQGHHIGRPVPVIPPADSALS